MQEIIDGDIRHSENSIKAADDIIVDANVTLQKDRNVVHNAQSEIEIRIDEKRKLEESLAVLKKKKAKIVMVVNLS